MLPDRSGNGETRYQASASTGEPSSDAEAGIGQNGQLEAFSEQELPMAAESSFDVVSKVDRQEVDNALNQAAKEVRQRFDFKNTDASIRWSGQTIEMEANSEERVKAVLDVFQTKLIKRGVSLKAVSYTHLTLPTTPYV